MGLTDRELLLTFFKNMVSYSPADSLDEGIGTRYERLVMNEWFQRLMHLYPINRILEFPCDGITGLLGINSLIFLREGRKVYLANPCVEVLQLNRQIWEKLGYSQPSIVLTSEHQPLPFPDDTFDLVWNFCMMERYKNPQKLISEMGRVSRNLVLVMTQNWWNIGTHPHRLYHFYKKRAWDHGYKRYMTMKGIKEVAEGVDLKIVECGGLDIPPILDTWDLPVRGVLQSLLKLLGKQWQWKATEKEEKSRLIGLFYRLENNLPNWFKLCQAHHLYILARKH